MSLEERAKKAYSDYQMQQQLEGMKLLMQKADKIAAVATSTFGGKWQPDVDHDIPVAKQEAIELTEADHALRLVKHCPECGAPVVVRNVAVFDLVDLGRALADEISLKEHAYDWHQKEPAVVKAVDELYEALQTILGRYCG